MPPRQSSLSPQVLKVIKKALALCMGCIQRNTLDPKWNPIPLGGSPLAAPYFLGKFLSAFLRPALPSPSPAERGKSLALVLYEIAKTLKTKEHPEDASPAEIYKTDKNWAVIYFYYFHRDKRKKAYTVALDLGIDELALYGPYGCLQKVWESFAQAVFQHIAPPLHPEPIPQVRLMGCENLAAPQVVVIEGEDLVIPQVAMIGREDLVAAALAKLQTKGTVVLTGPAGVGKTTFAAAVACQWPWKVDKVLRYTVRPRLTDNLYSFLFTLAVFLRQHGQTNLWSEIVASEDKNLTRRISELQGLLQHDLQKLGATPCVLWVDDVDLLGIDNPEVQPLLELLNALQGQIAMLWVGQPPLPIEAPNGLILQLQDFSLAEVEAWLDQNKIPYATDQSAKLHASTQGNPFRLNLWHALATPETRWETALRATQTSSLAVLFTQVWHRRLKEDERALLQSLAVFRRPAPSDEFSASLLQILLERGLVFLDDVAHVRLRPDVRQWVLDATLAAEQSSLHLLAAKVYVERWEYTEAAYHYVAGGKVAMAVALWFNHRLKERDKGQGPLALALFRSLNPAVLTNPADRDMWDIILTQLLKDAGETFEAQKWVENPSPTRAAYPYKMQLWADCLRERGQVPQALEKLRQALDWFTSGYAKRKVYLHQRRVHILTTLQPDEDDDNLDEAWKEAALAQASVEKMFGEVAEARNDYATAQRHYEAALRWAKAGEGRPAIADAHNDLGILAGEILGDLPLAYEHLREALRLYRELKNDWEVLRLEVNLGDAYNIGGQYAAAYALLQSTTAHLQAKHAPNLLAISACNLAESCYHLDKLDEAEHYAQLALQQEEEKITPYVYTLLGHIARARQQYPPATSFYQHAIQAAGNIKDLRPEGFAQLGLGKNYLAIAQLAQACSALAEALRCFTQIGMKAEIEETQKLLDTWCQQQKPPT